ncbi:hypothetical protein FB451DRAFT_1556663 [Mycena latifolia]|nr:hypothetical protein FB451DRAFT_1556663 [Mycena latifolia]
MILIYPDLGSSSCIQLGQRSCFIPLSPLRLGRDMVAALFIYALLASLCSWGRAALVNRTIADTSSAIQANCSVTHCNPNTRNSKPCNIPGAPNTSFTIFSNPCQIKIPFAGIAVYAFLACLENTQCEFQIDKTGLQANLLPDIGLANNNALSYFNNSLSRGQHTLVITSPSTLALNHVIYTSDQPTKSSPPIGAIVGAVLGGLALIAGLAALFVIFQRRSKRRRKTQRPILLERADPPSAESGSVGDNPALAEQIRELQAHTAELQVAVRAQRSPSVSTRLAAMKSEQSRAVQENAPAVPAADLLQHTDSGLRLTPARNVEELPPEYAAE